MHFFWQGYFTKAGEYWTEVDGEETEIYCMAPFNRITTQC